MIKSPFKFNDSYQFNFPGKRVLSFSKREREIGGERETEKEVKEGKERGNKKTRITTKENQEYITH